MTTPEIIFAALTACAPKTIVTTDYVDAHTFPNCPTTTNKYGNRIGPAYVETLNNGGIPILYVERTGYGSDATIKPYAYFGSSIRADGYTTATIGEVIKAVIDFDEIPF